MTARCVKQLVLAVAIVVFGSRLMHASSSEELRLRVPFDFLAGGQFLPAGEYWVEKMSETGLVVICGRSAGRVAAIFTVSSGSASLGAHPGLVFNTVGSTHVLSRVLLDGGEARVIP